MTDPNSPTFDPAESRRRTSTIGSVAQSVHSVTQGVTQAAENILHSDPPPGFFAATADAASRAPTVSDIRRGTFGPEGWPTASSPQTEHRTRTGSQSSGKRRSRLSFGERNAQDAQQAHGVIEVFPALTEVPTRVDQSANSIVQDERKQDRKVDFDHAVEPFSAEPSTVSGKDIDHDRVKQISPSARVYSSGYIPPPKISWTQSTAIAFRAFGKWLLTPFGFLLTLYGLNVVAWGGMLFLLLCNASRQMCWAPVPSAATQGHHSLKQSLALKHGAELYYNCNDLNSPRRIWLEIDSQILNALFCVTGFGLIPWRFRDLYYLLLWRLRSERKVGKIKKLYGLRTLAGIHNNWIRLPDSHTLDEMSLEEYDRQITTGSSIHSHSNDSDPLTDNAKAELASASASDEIDPRVPLPVSKRPSDPLTSVRAPPTALWKIDFFVWSQAWNTFFQVCLCGFMWGMDRYSRPSWATGLFIGLGCVIAGVGGWVSYKEGRKVNRVEGVQATNGGGEDGTEGEEMVGLQREETGGHESVHIGVGVGDRKGG